MDAAELLAQLRCAMTALLHLEALHKTELSPSDLPADAEYPFQAAVRIALTGTAYEGLLQTYEFRANREAFMLDIVGNTVCADLLDYAKRDSHFAGLRLDYDPDRIAENFTLVSFDAAAYEISHSASNGNASLGRKVPDGRSDPFAGWCLRTAISLISHKYRTDIPSELMNLLNVRYYLYERVIYHPTKCAAGSMLGTALQLLGWRGQGESDTRPTLPTHLRFVGDDVFLHDIRCALDFILGWVQQRDPGDRIDKCSIADIANVDQVHSGLVPALLRLQIGRARNEVEPELIAARNLLDRLAARRYFRPVFRALPSSNDTRLQAGAETLADVFRRPDDRYEAERQIETSSHLPNGSVTIHCPKRTTARKIANVLLTRPGDSADDTCKLKDIGALDAQIFGEHQKAVKAVEEMYGSMWRLSVYVAPEYLYKFEEIGRAAGQVIFRTIDEHEQFGDKGEVGWVNDEHLVRELESKFKTADSASRATELKPLSDLMIDIGEGILESGVLANVSPSVLKQLEEKSAPVRAKIEEAIVQVLNSESPSSKKGKAPEAPGGSKADRIVQIFKLHIQRPSRQEVDSFKRRYAGPLALCPMRRLVPWPSNCGPL